ncbi:D-sedoheptulose-7-phosphate isomerase [Acuticoccus sp.]|uniref:D-sedoheptulose-7-phosphate isomerase n=1 Tax=Acuticoccus sp. TaxID=1904378 RepID=UPI003B52A46A
MEGHAKAAVLVDPLGELWQGHLDRHAALVAATGAACADPFAAATQLLVRAFEAGCTAFFCGNGGSAADAQHLAAELTVRFVRDRVALPALALATDPSAMTACGNDLGFERVFARQVEALGRPGDVLIAISTSGGSGNIVAALKVARAAGLATILLTGGREGAARAHADVVLAVPSEVTAHIQELHIVIGHALCHAVEAAMGFDR